MAGDWIKAYRSMMDSSVWNDEWLVKLWLWCLFKANHRDGVYKGKLVKRGQFITGRNTASDELGVSPSKWYRGIQKLVDFGNVTFEANSEWTMISVCNYTSYQDGEFRERTANEQRSDSERTASDTTSGQPADTIEEGKKGRREEIQNNVFAHDAQAPKPNGKPGRTKPRDMPYSDDFRRFWEAFPSGRKKNKVAAWEAWLKAITREAPLNIIDAAEEYADSKEGRGEYVKMPSTWLNQDCWEDDRAAWDGRKRSRVATLEELERWNPIDGGCG